MAKHIHEKSEREFQGQMDARTLTEANEIRGDKGRMKNAQTQAKKQADATRKEATALDKVARHPVPKKKVVKKAAKKASKKSGGRKVSRRK